MTVNCTHKLVLGPKKSILKFEWYPLFKACFHIMLLSKCQKMHSHTTYFTKFPMGHTPTFPLSAPGVLLVRLVVGSYHPPPLQIKQKKTFYRLDAYDTMT